MIPILPMDLFNEILLVADIKTTNYLCSVGKNISKNELGSFLTKCDDNLWENKLVQMYSNGTNFAHLTPKENFYINEIKNFYIVVREHTVMTTIYQDVNNIPFNGWNKKIYTPIEKRFIVIKIFYDVDKTKKPYVVDQADTEYNALVIINDDINILEKCYYILFDLSKSKPRFEAGYLSKPFRDYTASHGVIYNDK